jgi:hypothetical protein
MALPTDFRTPFFAVAIRSASGAILPLWQLSDEDSEVTRQIPSTRGFAWVQQVTVENQLGDVPILSAMLTPPFREGLEFLDSEFMEFGNSELQIQIGYSDPKIAPQVFTGLLLEPSVSIGTDIQITLNAHGIGGSAALRNEGGLKSKPGESRLSLIKRIAATVNMEIDVSDLSETPSSSALSLTSDSIFTAVGIPTTSEDIKKGKTEKLLTAPYEYAQGNKTAWTSLWELINGANAWMILVSKANSAGEETRPILRIVPRDKALSQPPTRVLRLYDLNEGRLGNTGDPSVVSGNATGQAPTEYPLLSLSNPPAAMYLPGMHRALLMDEISDKEPEKEITEVLNHENVTDTKTNEGAVAPDASAKDPEFDSRTKVGGERLPGDPTLDKALEAAVAEFRRAGNMGIQLEVETIGIPDLAPGETILLTGIGRKFGTPRWGVHKVVHTVGTDGFSTSMTVVSNADAVLGHGIQHEDVANKHEAKSEDELIATVKV